MKFVEVCYNENGDSMTLFMYLLMTCIIVCLVFIWYINTYNKFQSYIIRMNEAEANIDTILRKRFDLLNKSISIIKANAEIEEDILSNIVKLRSRKLTNFDLDRELYEAINEFNHYKESYPVLQTSESFVKIDLGLNETETEIYACRKYYNDIVTDYNKIVRTFPSNVVSKICHLKEKTYFDGKNMNDDILNDFKL